jgi:hypothetical protein
MGMNPSTWITSLSSMQGLLLAMKLTGQITWPWLSVLAPTLIVIFGLGLFTLLLILGLMGGK